MEHTDTTKTTTSHLGPNDPYHPRAITSDRPLRLRALVEFPADNSSRHVAFDNRPQLRAYLNDHPSAVLVSAAFYRYGIYSRNVRPAEVRSAL